MPTFPTTLNNSANRGQFWLEHNVQVFISPLNRSEQRQSLTGARWRARLEWDSLIETDAFELLAFLDARDGPANSFDLHNPVQRSIKGAATAGGLVKGASQTGGSLTTDAWGTSVTGLFKAGDLFQVGTELKRITQDIDSDGLGEATLVFKPNLRASPADNAPIVITDAKAVVRLLDTNQGAADISAPNYYNFVLEFVEAF